MKRIMLITMLINMPLLYAAASSSEQPVESMNTVNDVIDALRSAGSQMAEFNFMDRLEDVISELPQEKIDTFIRILLQLGKAENAVLDKKLLKRALVLSKIDLSPSDIQQIRSSSIMIRPKESNFWSSIKILIPEFSVALVGTCAVIKALQLYAAYRSHHATVG